MSESAHGETRWLVEQREMRMRLSTAMATGDPDPVVAELLDLLTRTGPRSLALALTPEVSSANLDWEDGLARLLAAEGGTPPQDSRRSAWVRQTER